MKLITAFFILITLKGFSQTSYKLGDIVADIPAKKILNYAPYSSSLKNLQSNITIIDFFGTWCIPCVKALPELGNFKTKFKEDINIILVSTEEESKLSKFIANHQPFIFPLVVDKDNAFTNAFMPPAYPYTIVLDKNFKIISISNAIDLTENMLEQFIVDQKNIAPTELTAQTINTDIKKDTTMATFTGSSNTLVKLSQDFMYAAKTNEDVTAFVNQLAGLTYTELINNLKDDDEKKAFWINLYNAYINSSLHKNPGLYKSRNKFFKTKNIIVAGKTLSLDKIEHGILRRSKIKWSLGYLSKLFPSKTEKELRVDKLDYRIHFALNCGAKSCPPIAFYNTENLSRQLDIATTAYLNSETVYNKEKNILQLPAIVSWFRKDFGGKKKIIQLLKTKQLLQNDVKPKIIFKKYDWTLYLDNFKK